MADLRARLKWRVLILRNAGERDDLNSPTDEWRPIGIFWAEKIDRKPIEAWRAGQTAATLESAFRLRWSPSTATIKPADRLVCEGLTFAIAGVSEPVRRTEIEIVGIAGQDGART